jgi:hypothetical protein
MAAANVAWAKNITRHHCHFAIAALDPEVAWRLRSRDLDALVCFKFYRVVALDHTVRSDAQFIDIHRPGPLSLA